MASVITATVSSGLTQQADNSGVLQLASGTGNLVTVPSVTGTAMVSGNMPAFSAYNSSTQSVSNSTATKLVCNTELFDTSNAFDSTTNYRFTPQVAGYYQINVSGYGFPSAVGVVSMQIWKNGAYSLTKTEVANTNAGPQISCSSLIYLNGSTDYVEFYAFQNSGGSLTMSAQNFSGSLVRAA